MAHGKSFQTISTCRPICLSVTYLDFERLMEINAGFTKLIPVYIAHFSLL